MSHIGQQQPAVNRLVAGSSPARGANLRKVVGDIANDFSLRMDKPISAKISKGWGKVTVNSLSFQVQFETTKIEEAPFFARLLL